MSRKKGLLPEASYANWTPYSKEDAAKDNEIIIQKIEMVRLELKAELKEWGDTLAKIDLLACEISKKYDVFDYELLIIFLSKKSLFKNFASLPKRPFFKVACEKSRFYAILTDYKCFIYSSL